MGAASLPLGPPLLLPTHTQPWYSVCHQNSMFVKVTSFTSPRLGSLGAEDLMGLGSVPCSTTYWIYY